MLRILIFILSAAFFALLATVLLGIEGRLTAEAFGARYDIHTGAALLFVLILIALVMGALWLFRSFARIPERLSDRMGAGRREKGLEALNRGFEAIAVGDGAAALREAEIAERKLQDMGLTRLLRAQASLLSGDSARAEEAFSAMLAAPQSEFLGLRGLFLQAERAGDRGAMLLHAERAFRLRPNAQWAFDSFFAGGLQRGAWGEMREALSLAEKNGAVEREKARRGRAALLAADAAAAASSGDEKLALSESERALKLAPDFTPAAVLAARLQALHKKGRALKTLEKAFAANPHAALIDAAAALADESPERRAEALDRLADEAPASPEASLARATARLSRRDHAGAAALLEPLLRERASARLCTLMAEAALATGGADREAIARDWLKKAAAAPREPDLSRGGVQLSRAGWAGLVRDFMETGRLGAPALDAEGEGLSEDELKRLAFLPRPPESPGEPPPAETADPAEPKKPDAEDAMLVGDRVSAARAIAAAGEVS
jgi:HemY protein